MNHDSQPPSINKYIDERLKKVLPVSMAIDTVTEIVRGTATTSNPTPVRDAQYVLLHGSEEPTGDQVKKIIAKVKKI